MSQMLTFRFKRQLHGDSPFELPEVPSTVRERERERERERCRIEPKIEANKGRIVQHKTIANTNE